MKKSILLLLGATTSFIIGCGQKYMPTIDDDTAIKIANDMYKRHHDPSLFQLPNKFTITYKYSNSYKQNTEEGHEDNPFKSTTTYYFDLDNLYYRIHKHSSSSSNTNTADKYQFYDNGVGIFYTAYNNNGYKTRHEDRISEKMAKERLEDIRKSRDLEPYITDDYSLLTLKDEIAFSKEQHEKYKDEKDQHYNYFLGSNNNKSLQMRADAKIKDSMEQGPIVYEGYAKTNAITTYTNDLLASSTRNSNSKYIDKTGKFYIEYIRNESVSTSYNKCFINKIKISDYILVD